MTTDLVYRLKKRAEIRRQIPNRKSVQNGERDRLADLLEEAAEEIQRLNEEINNAQRPAEPVEWLHINGTSDTKWYPPQRPAEPVGWLRAIDEALVIHHCGVAYPLDDYETAKDKLNNLLCCVQDIATYFAKEQSPEECK